MSAKNSAFSSTRQLRFDAVGMAHPADQTCPLVTVGNGVTRTHLEPYLAGRLWQQASNDAQRRGFAGAIGAFQRHHLSGGDRKAEIAKNAPSGAFAGQVFHLHEAENGHQSVILRQYICWPPLMDRVDPVMKPASSATRKTTPRAISCACPSLPTGMRATIFSSTCAGTADTISVSI